VAKDLAHIAAASLSVLEPGGTLVFATNSTKVTTIDLDRALAEGAADQRADIRIFQRLGLPPDFPVAPGFPEGNYLKVALAVKV
jgi:23S rRNA (cytosine1962-C5)-methyltransferase